MRWFKSKQKEKPLLDRFPEIVLWKEGDTITLLGGFRERICYFVGINDLEEMILRNPNCDELSSIKIGDRASVYSSSSNKKCYFSLTNETLKRKYLMDSVSNGNITKQIREIRDVLNSSSEIEKFDKLITAQELKK